MKDDDDIPVEFELDLLEWDESAPAPVPLPPPQSQEDLKAALANERFLEISADAELELLAADMWAAHQMMDAGLLNEHVGKYVAVLRRQLVGADEDSEKLRDEVSKQYAVHPNRVAMIFFDDGW